MFSQSVFRYTTKGFIQFYLGLDYFLPKIINRSNVRLEIFLNNSDYESIELHGFSQLDNDQELPDQSVILFQINSKTFHVSNQDLKQDKIRLDFSGKTNGFFIQSEDNSLLEEFKVYRNDSIWLQLKQIQLFYMCEKFSNSLWFLPFDNENSEPTQTNSYALNMDRLTIDIGVSVREKDISVTIHALTPNMLIYKDFD